MCDFKPGDEVVCVNAAPIADPGGVVNDPDPCLIEGRVYVIAGVIPQPFFGDYGVLLAGCPAAFQRRNGIERLAGYNPSRFRKVERRTDKRSLTEWLSQPSGDTDHLDKPIPAKKRERA